LRSATNLDLAGTSCFCDHGIQIFDCAYSQVATGTCASYYIPSEGMSVLIPP
jgi:hypothetical protein